MNITQRVHIIRENTQQNHRLKNIYSHSRHNQSYIHSRRLYIHTADTYPQLTPRKKRNTITWVYIFSGLPDATDCRNAKIVPRQTVASIALFRPITSPRYPIESCPIIDPTRIIAVEVPATQGCCRPSLQPLSSPKEHSLVDIIISAIGAVL